MARSLRDINIGPRLSIGFALLFIFLFALTLFSINAMNKLSEQTTALYKHPLAVSNAALRIETNILKINHVFKNIISANTLSEIERESSSLYLIEKEVIEDFGIIDKFFLGERENYKIAVESFSSWKTARDEAISLIHSGHTADAARIAEGISVEHLGAVELSIEILEDFAQKKALEYINVSEQVRKTTLNRIYTVLILSIVISVVFAVYITRSITRPIEVLVNAADRIGKGELTTDIESTSHDEIGRLAGAFNKMTINLAASHQALNKEIKERITINKTLKESQRRLNEAQKLAHLGSWEWDILTGKVDWSDEEYRKFGYKPGEVSVTFDLFKNSIHTQDRDRVIEALKNALNGSEPYDIEYRIIQPGGEERTIWAQGEVSRNSRGEPVKMIGTGLDITEKKKAEEALRESEEKFRGLFEQSPDSVMIYDFTLNKIVDFNPRFQETLGYDREEIELLDIPDFEAKESPDEFKKHLSEIVQQGGGSFESRYRKKNGELIDVLISSRVVRIGEKTFGLAIFRDITDQKKTETELKESEERFRKVFEDSPLGKVLADRSGRYIKVNKALTAILGYSQEELLSMNIADVTLPGEITHNSNIIQEIWSGKRDFFTAEKRYLHRNGSVIWGQITVSPIYNTDGKVIYTLGQLQDITARKKAEEERALLFLAVETATEAINIVDDKVMIIYANDAMNNLFGYEKGELIGRHVSVLNPPDLTEKITADIVTSLEQNGAWTGEIPNIKKDGTEFVSHATATAMKDDSGRINYVISTQHDITHRKQTEKKLDSYLRQLEKANSELSDFAYIVSHDLKEPLRAVHSLAKWIIEDYADRFDAEGKEKMHLLMGRVRRMNDLVEGILQYSRAGRLIIEKNKIDLNQIAAEVINILHPPRHVRVTIDGTLPTVQCERTSMAQIFQNLIGNAIKYMDKPEGDVHISASDEKEAWKICVSDNGPGIREKDHERIFQMFRVLQPRDQVEASGVGLAVVKKIVEMYGGKVWVESEAGKGSRFYFTIPK
ncbi:MAG: PAS domain S-box protein [Nitrospiraceae bacterium]|nr:MAG: PAS domain S-box protein [Nitrospiraceae bacterium]